MQLALPEYLVGGTGKWWDTNQRLTRRQTRPVVPAVPILGRPTLALVRGRLSLRGFTQTDSLEESL
ncbi:hypothetical protein PN498_02040 [Oscillatoria sp. CS-180]|uniref:hypothetical protein n=1 Tax=Oscillatoria sp. CS-180 TaxID=3021720 RepID=UPI00232E34F5|nr:hypothetical protein [Oscillatoria sp. CS-180]MDB9524754.1 hypothetical protein [Oscillatoria sp. CS-180]